MSNENHNNWKHKLEQLDSLPEENRQYKNAAWEKLYARMNGKKQSKKKVWHWVAAASILFAVMISIIIFNKKTSQVDSVTIKQKPSEIKNSVVVITDKKDSVKNSNPVLSEEKGITVEAKPNRMEHKTIPEKEIIKLRLSNTVSVKNLVTETGNNFLQPIDTSAYLTTIIPVKKKLKVVQINELGDAEEDQPGVVRNTDKHLFQFKFGNQEIYTNPSVATTEKGLTILKIKTSTN